MAITPEGYSRRQSKVLTAKSMAELLGQRSCTAWAGRTSYTNTGRFWFGCSRCWQWLARLRIQFYHSCSVRESKLMDCKFRAVTSHIFFVVKWNFQSWMELARSRCRPKPRRLLRSFFRSRFGLWVKLWHRNKTTCSESNPVQNIRSKLTTCLRKGRLLRFTSNSTATSDGGAQKLGNELRRDHSELIATKVWSPNIRKCEAIFECHVETCKTAALTARASIFLVICFW